MTKEKKEDISFEKALARLQDIVEQMESGEIALDETLSAYEEGTRLLQACAKKLEDAELRIREVGEQGAGADGR